MTNRPPDLTGMLNASASSREEGLLASLMEVSEKTIQRQWALAKIWLYEAIQKDT